MIFHLIKTYYAHIIQPSVRKQHNAGYKHKANVRAYYQQFEEQQTQSLIDQKVKEHLGQTAAVYQQAQMGGAFHQHLTALGQFKPPITLSVLPIPVSGSIAGGAGAMTVPSIRPPVLLVPAIPSLGSYASTTVAPQFRVPPLPRPPGITTHVGQSTGSTVMQLNGFPWPPVPSPPGASNASVAPGAPGVSVARSTPSMDTNGLTAAYSNTSLQPSNCYSQQRGLSKTSRSQSSYGYGPPSHGPYTAPPSRLSVSYKN